MLGKIRCAFICILTLAVWTMTACGGGDSVAFTVNGVRVEKEELVYYMRDYSSLAAAEMESAYGVDSAEEGFWGGTYGELVPLDYLKAYTAERIARVKLEQIMAGEQGIETPLTWTEQHEDMEKQNRRRREDYEAGQVVYGSIERDFVTYFADLYYAMRAGLQEKLGLDEEAYAALVESRLETAEIRYKDMEVSPEDIA